MEHFIHIEPARSLGGNGKGALLSGKFAIAAGFERGKKLEVCFREGFMKSAVAGSAGCALNAHIGAIALKA